MLFKLLLNVIFSKHVYQITETCETSLIRVQVRNLSIKRYARFNTSFICSIIFVFVYITFCINVKNDWNKRHRFSTSKWTKPKTSTFKCKEQAPHFWNNVVNSNRQTFWQYYSSKQISDRYKKLLEKNSAQMLRKVENETKKKRKPFSMSDIV